MKHQQEEKAKEEMKEEEEEEKEEEVKKEEVKEEVEEKHVILSCLSLTCPNMKAGWGGQGTTITPGRHTPEEGRTGRGSDDSGGDGGC